MWTVKNMPPSKRNWQLTVKQEKIYANLWRQVEKSFDFRQKDQGYRGKERYREGLRSFCKHLAIHYQSQNFKNIRDEHLRSYIEASKKVDINMKTLKTELSAIRKLHAKTENTRYTLSKDNGLLGTEKRSTRGIDRAWRNSEVQKAVLLAKNMERRDIAWSIQLARCCGLRIEEATALTRTQLRNAVERGYLALTNTKGGISRDIPLNRNSQRLFREILDQTRENKTDYLFIGHGRTHHQAYESIQNWIYNHRDKFQEFVQKGESDHLYEQQLQIELSRKESTFHGLRHAFAREEYEKRIMIGMKPLQARQEVAELLGHGRDDVTRIYVKS